MMALEVRPFNPTSCSPSESTSLEELASTHGFPTLEEDARYGDFGRAFYKFSTPDRQDHSFQVWQNGEPVLHVAVDRIGECLGWSGFPARMFFRQDGSVVPKKATDKAIRHLIELAKKSDCRLQLCCGCNHGVLDSVGLAALKMGAEIDVTIAAVSNLQADTATLWRELRSRYRQLVRWGENNLVTKVVRGTDSTSTDFLRYRNLHLAATGTNTRPDSSWDYQANALRNDRALLVLSNLADGTDVAACFIGLGTRHAVYWSGAYDRENFDKPISHYPMYRAMMESKALKLESFDLGEVSPSLNLDKKLRDIAFFKRGFTGARTVRLIAKWEGSEV